jgi:hypothetical protein
MENTNQPNSESQPEVKKVVKEKVVTNPVEFKSTGALEGLEKELSNEEKIVNFLKGKKEYEKLNDFLKSLYPLPKQNEPAAWLNRRTCKGLKTLLEDMKASGKIDIQGDAHKLLGSFYHEGQQQFTRHHNLSTVEVWAKI